MRLESTQDLIKGVYISKIIGDVEVGAHVHVVERLPKGKKSKRKQTRNKVRSTRRKTKEKRGFEWRIRNNGGFNSPEFNEAEYNG